MHEYRGRVFANILTDHPDRDKYIALTDTVNELFLSNASSACISKEVRKFELLFLDVVSEKPRSLMILREGGSSLLHLTGDLKATDERVEALVVRALGGTGRVRFKINF